MFSVITVYEILANTPKELAYICLKDRLLASYFNLKKVSYYGGVQNEISN